MRYHSLPDDLTGLRWYPACTYVPRQDIGATLTIRRCSIDGYAAPEVHVLGGTRPTWPPYVATTRGTVSADRARPLPLNLPVFAAPVNTSFHFRVRQG